MNPQQFNMGMSRPMQNMQQMNPAFNGMNNQMGNMALPMQPQQNIVQHPQLQKFIFSYLQNQGIFDGWQATIQPTERMQQVKQLIDSLRLVRPPIEIQKLAQVALQYEEKAFKNSATRELYMKEVHEKLAKIKETRNQAAQAQSSTMQMQQNMSMQGINPMTVNMNQMQNPQMRQNIPQPPQQLQQQMPNQQNQNMNRMAPQNQKPGEQLTQADNRAINQRAAELASATSKEEMKNIVSRMVPQFCESLRAKGVEPIIYYFRMMATREFRAKKGEVQQAPNPAMMQNQPPQQNQPFAHFEGLQAQGLKSQETGEMVVPASNNQGVVPGIMRGNQMVNQGYLEQQRRLQLQQQQLQRNAAIRQQQQAQTPHGQNPAQTNIPMPMLNRPVNPNMPVVNPQNIQRPNSRPQPQQQSSEFIQKKEAFLGQFSADQQNVLRGRPPQEWTTIVSQNGWKPSNALGMQRSNSQNPQSMRRPQQMPGPFVGGANIGTPMQQSLSAGPASMQQTPQQLNQEMIRQRQAQMQQQQMQANQAAQQPQQPRPPQQSQQLNPQQQQYMDGQQIPQQLMNNIRQMIKVPDVPTWGHLKQWAMNQPSAPNILQMLNRVQFSHMQFIIKARQAQQQQQGQGPAQSQPPQMQANNQMQQPRPTMNPQQLRPPTAQDLQNIRARNPQLLSLSDDQIRSMVMEKQRAQLQQAAQRAGAPQMPPNQQPQMQQPPQQRPQPNQGQVRKTPVQQNKQPEPFKAEQLNQGPKQLPRLTQEQIANMDPKARVNYMRTLRLPKMRDLWEQAKTNSQLRPQKLDPATRQQMKARLSNEHVKNMMNRFDQFLLVFPEMDNNEAAWRKFVQYKHDLFAQYQPGSPETKAWIPVDTLSVTPERLETMLSELSAQFGQMHQTVNKTQQQQSLTPENLSRLEAQEQERKKSKGSNAAPPAPTTDRPPFQFGDTRGHGAPKYGNQGLKQEDLKMPVDPKRRKKNPATATPTNATPVATSATPPAVLPQPPQQLSNMFRCNVVNCERQVNGFTSQAELDQHVSSTHQIDMDTLDPVQFLDETLQDVFNLDENLQPLKTDQTGGKNNITSADSPMQDWEAVKFTADDAQKVFGDWDWEDVVPASAPDMEREFLDAYRASEDWQKLLRTPASEHTETSKSTSPPIADKEEPTKKDKEHEVGFVDLSSIEGLDLTGLDGMMGVDANTAMTDSRAASIDSFEIVNEPSPPPQSGPKLEPYELEFLASHNIDPSDPSKLTADQKRLMDFIVEPIGPHEQEMGSGGFDNIDNMDWDTIEKQREEDIRNQVPGTLLPNGTFIPILGGRMENRVWWPR